MDGDCEVAAAAIAAAVREFNGPAGADAPVLACALGKYIYDADTCSSTIDTINVSMHDAMPIFEIHDSMSSGHYIAVGSTNVCVLSSWTWLLLIYLVRVYTLSVLVLVPSILAAYVLALLID